MKEWQTLLGMLAIAVAVLIAGILIAQAVRGAGLNMSGSLNSMGELIRSAN